MSKIAHPNYKRRKMQEIENRKPITRIREGRGWERSRLYGVRRH
jgi:hypothetical protein